MKLRRPGPKERQHPKTGPNQSPSQGCQPPTRTAPSRHGGKIRNLPAVMCWNPSTFVCQLKNQHHFFPTLFLWFLIKTIVVTTCTILNLSPEEEILFFFSFSFFFLLFSLKGEKTVHIVGGEDGTMEKSREPSAQGPTAQCSQGQLAHSYCGCLRRRERRRLVSRGKEEKGRLLNSTLRNAKSCLQARATAA